MTWKIVGREREESVADSALQNGFGLIVAGSAGTGTSALVAQVISRFATSPTAQRVIHVSGSDPRLRRTVEEELDSIARDESDPRLIVDVDGAHRASQETLAWLCVNARREAFSLVVTVRSPPPIDDHLVTLWKDGKSTRIDLEPLDHAMVTKALATRLNGVVSADLAWHVWTRAAGNPRHTHALIDEGLRSGSIVLEHDTWLLKRELLPGQPVLDLVSNELISLPQAKRDVLQMVALAGALPLSQLLRLVNPTALDELIDHGRLEVIRTNSSMDATIRITQPTFAAAVRSLTRPGRSRELFERVMAHDSVRESRADSYEHLIQRVNWAIASGIDPDRETLIDAYRAASRLDRRVDTERLATAALHAMEPSDPRQFDALLARAMAKRLLGRIHEALDDMRLAEAALTDSLRANQSDEYVSKRLRLTIAVANAHHFGLDELRQAQNIIDDQLARNANEGHHAIVTGLTGLRAQHDAYGGTFDAIERTRDLGQSTGGVPIEAKLEMYMPLVFSQALHGDLSGAITAATSHVEEAVNIAESFPWAAQEAQSALLMLFLWAGHIEQAEALMALTDSAAPPSAHIDHAMVQTGWGMLHAVHAEWEQARSQFRATSARFRTLDFSGWLPITLTWEALASAAAGDMAGCASSLEEARALPLRASAIVAFDLRERWCRTAIALALPDASELVHTLVHDAQDQGLDLAELWGWHCLALLDSQHESLARMPFDRLEYLGELPLPQARLDHIRAILANDVKGMSVAAGKLTRLGVWTPMRNRSATSLSARQREVAKLAAAGLTAKEISERLFLSVRTVESHLGHIYTRLGVHTRAELALLLAAQGADQ